MEEDVRLLSVNSSNKKSADSNHGVAQGRNSLRSNKVHKSGLSASFFDHLQRNLTKIEDVAKIRGNKNLSKIALQKELNQDSLLKSKQYLKELNCEKETDCLFVSQAVQEFLKECFSLNLKSESFISSQLSGFFDSLISCLILTSNENVSLLRFFSLNDKIRIFTYTWNMEITLNQSGKIKSVKISTSDKIFFDKCSKTTSRLRQILNECDWLEEVDVIVSFETKAEKSKTFSYKAYGCSNKNLDCTEISEERNSKKLNLLI